MFKRLLVTAAAAAAISVPPPRTLWSGFNPYRGIGRGDTSKQGAVGLTAF